MAANKRKKSKSSQSRKPFWESLLEWLLGFVKKLIIPALVLWMVTWLWIGGVFAKTGDAMWDKFVVWTAEQGLIVTDVAIEGRNRTDISKLQTAVQAKPNDPLLGVDVDTIQARIQALKWVDTVNVKRSYNGIVTIKLVEKIPFVVWDKPGTGRVVVDTSGKVIKGVSASDFNDLLIVGGVGAPKNAADLMEILTVEQSVANRIKAAQWIGDRRWDLISVNGTRIMLPETDIGFALSRLAKLQDTQNILARDLLSIDLRLADRIIVESKKGEAQDISGDNQQSKMDAI